MTITIELHPDEERALRERARQNGRDVAEYIHLVLKEHIERPSSFAQVLAPVWEGFRQGGLSEDEAAELLEGELRAARDERKARP